MDLIAKKTMGKETIDDYQQYVQNMNNWFDGIIKKMDVLDKGSGLNCNQKLVIISEIKSDFQDQGPVKLAELKDKVHNVTQIISNLDAQQVEEQLKTVERRYNDVSKRIDRKAQILEITNKGFEGARVEIEQLQNWANKHIAELQNEKPLGYESKSAEERIQQLKALGKEADAKQAVIESLEKRITNMQNELEPLEQSQLESELRNLSASQKQLSGLIKSEIASVLEAAVLRKKLEADIEKARSWLSNKLIDLRKVPGYLPLQSITIDSELQTCKKIENDIKEFNDGILNDVTNQVKNILKDCQDDDKEKLQTLLDTIESDYKTLKDESNNKIKSLADLLQGRKSFETDVQNFSIWLNETDLSTSGEIRTSTLPLLEEQLAKYEKFAVDSNKMGELLQSITDQAKTIAPTLNNPDKLKLNEQVKNLKDKYGKITNNINNKIKQLQDHIKKYKEAKAKLAECVQFLSGIQQKIRELNKPIGSKIEDVLNLLTAYEQILNDLKDSKAKMGDIHVDNLPELQSILGQQDDMIKLIEDQLAHLRQLLLLREQYIALINDIIAFIMKYTSVITDIEKSPDTIEDKIKQYDEVIVKIQECEALLASANDKGQKIASEGNAADVNSITEQLQSLKQQLQNLRKLVETQRQKHEITLAEHKKMAADLTEVLDWLHENETIAKSRPLLDRDPDSVEREIQKHKLFSDDVEQHLNKIRKINEQAQNEIGLPSSIFEMISEGKSLLAILPNELEEREKYLDNNKVYRLEYMNLVQQFNGWIHAAEICLQNGKHGVDYENIFKNLEEHIRFFSAEPTIRDLVSKQIQAAADKIWPSLNAIEQEELSRELQNHTQVLKNTLNSSKSQRAQLDQDAETWRDYCQMCEKILAIIDRIKYIDEPVSNLAGLHFNTQKLTHALNDIQVSF